jgi:hypothetical protein
MEAEDKASESDDEAAIGSDHDRGYPRVSRDQKRGNYAEDG